MLKFVNKFLLISTAIFLFFLIQTNIFQQRQSQTKANHTPSNLRVIKPTDVLGEKIQNVSPSNRAVYIGFWTQGLWDDYKKELHLERLKEIETMIGKKVAIAHYYRGWEFLASNDVRNELTVLGNNGWRPMISANPYFFSRCVYSGLALYKTIAEGNCDAFLHDVGKNLNNYGQKVFLRFAWEMNVDSMEWSLKRTRDNLSNWKAAWRRFHDILLSEGANNVDWVFSPNVGEENFLYQDIYPGDNYVDWVGLDGYNWGTTQSWSRWQSFIDVFGNSYKSLVNVAPNKPLMLAEVNTTNIGGDKALWYEDMLKKQLPNNFPNISAIIFYNEDKSEKENVNWLIDITPASKDAFSEGIALPLYHSTFN